MTQQNISNTLFSELILNGIPHELPTIKEFDSTINHTPKEKTF